MVKLTAELIESARHYVNPVRHRELDLRGYKIPVIENLGATLDQFDSIDFSDNDIRKLDGFPFLNRLKWLLFNHNRIVRIASGLENVIPNLESLILTGNLIQELADLDPLAALPKLTSLCLIHCPVEKKAYYRQYLAFKLPNLKLLDFKKIKKKDRDEAVAFFKSRQGREVQRDIARKSKLYSNTGKARNPPRVPMRNEEIWKIREAINRASTLEEVEQLQRLLQSGQMITDEESGNPVENGEGAMQVS